MTYKDFLTNWYGKGRVPAFGTLAYSRFVSDNLILAKNVSGDKEVMITFKENIDTACCDIGNKSIYLPAATFVADYYNKIIQYPVDQRNVGDVALIAVTGFTIHEAHHIKFSPSRFDLLSVGVEKKYPKHLKTRQNIANIVEDLYIDTEANQSALGNFVRVLSDIFFHDNNFLSSIEAWEKNKTWGTGINLLCQFKRIDNRNHAIWDKYPTLRDAMLPACKTGLSILTRQRVVFDVFEALYKLLPEDEQKNTDPEGTGDGGNVRLGMKPNGTPISDLDIANLRDGTRQKEILQIEQEVQEELNMHAVGETKTGIPKVRIGDVMGLRIGDTVEDHPNFKGFASYLQHIRVMKRTKRPSDVGKKLIKNQLHRWVTDQKILDGTTRQKQQETPEIVLLVDASGSMGRHFYREVLSAAKAVYNSCKQAGISISVLAHTTDDYYSVVYPIVSHRMTGYDTVDSDLRFSHASTIQQRCNADGVAILEASKRFTRRSGEKYLLVLSDGQPSGAGNYDGDFAYNHTKHAANTLRKKGIQVISVSLKPEVVRTNNEIYGQQYNIKATTKTELEIGLKHLLESLS